MSDYGWCKVEPWNIFVLVGSSGCGKVPSELVLCKKNFGCVDAWGLDPEMLLSYALKVTAIMAGILKLKASIM